jgi:hypothetical protein
MFRSDAGHGPLSGEILDDKRQQIPAFPHSLASIPAGLEVVPTNDKQTQEPEKETVSDLPEAISQAEKEVSDTWAYAVPIPSQDRPPKRRICGLKRKFFWIIVVAGPLVLGLALIVGLGAGLGLRKPRKSASCDSCMFPCSEVADMANKLNSYPEHSKLPGQPPEERCLRRCPRRRRCRKTLHRSHGPTIETREPR